MSTPFTTREIEGVIQACALAGNKTRPSAVPPSDFKRMAKMLQAFLAVRQPRTEDQALELEGLAAQLYSRETLREGGLPTRWSRVDPAVKQQWREAALLHKDD